MKIRNGFISNSSSTSFVVAYKKAESAAGLCRDLDLHKVMEYASFQSLNDETDVHAWKKKEIIDKFMMTWLDDNYIDKNERPSIREVLSEIEEIDESEWNLLMFDLSYHDEVTSKILKIMERDGDIKVLFKRND